MTDPNEPMSDAQRLYLAESKLGRALQEIELLRSTIDRMRVQLDDARAKVNDDERRMSGLIAATARLAEENSDLRIAARKA